MMGFIDKIAKDQIENSIDLLYNPDTRIFFIVTWKFVKSI